MDRTARPGSLSSRLAPQATVLVVEDEVDIATFLRAYLKASGPVAVEHLVPRSAAEVVRAVRDLDAGCVLLDVHLGTTTAFEVLDALRADGLLPDLPVIVVTADGRDATAAKVREHGAVEVYCKPFDVRLLYEDVADLLGVGGDR